MGVGIEPPSRNRDIPLCSLGIEAPRDDRIVPSRGYYEPTLRPGNCAERHYTSKRPAIDARICISQLPSTSSLC